MNDMTGDNDCAVLELVPVRTEKHFASPTKQDLSTCTCTNEHLHSFFYGSSPLR